MSDPLPWEEKVAQLCAASPMVKSIIEEQALDIDSTTLTAISECFSKGILQGVLSRWPGRSMGPLAFGQAVHKGYEVLLLGGSTKEVHMAAIEEANQAKLDKCGDEKRNYNTLQLVLNDIILDHKISTDRLKPVELEGKPMVEIPFRVPLGEAYIVREDPEDTLPVQINWTGKIDAICAFRDDGMLWPVDHKTTTAFGPKFLDTYIRNYQFPGYVWANTMLHEVFQNEPRGIAVNVIAMRKAGNEIKRLKVPYAQWKLEEWQRQTLEQIQAFVQNLYDFTFANGPLYINRANCTTKFGRCGFFDLCDYHPRMRERMFFDEQYYVEHLWSPFHA